MEKLVELATQLGKEIAAHPRYEAFARASEMIADDEAAGELVNALTQQIRKIAELEREMKPVEVGDKHELEHLQEQAAQNIHIQEFMRAQADYVELMRNVNDAIKAELDATEDGTSERDG